jgi:hypothetical protein
LRNGGKHKAQFYLPFKRLCSFSEQSSISFIYRFDILSEGEPAKMCQTRKMRSQMFAGGGQWNQKYEHGFIHAVILLELPAMWCITVTTCIVALRWLSFFICN